MATAIRPIRHEDRLTLIGHLEELRQRLLVSLAVLVVAFGICFWQNHALLRIINHPLKTQTAAQNAKGHGTVGQATLAQQGLLGVAANDEKIFRLLSQATVLPPAMRTQLSRAANADARAVANVPRHPVGDNPVTLGVGEPFTTTLTVSFIFALILALPVLLLELYGFVLPALRPGERRVAMPLMAAVPLLFSGGVLFGYFVALPAATRFFLNFNSGEFNVFVQASQYYRFAALILLAMGLIFQVPVGVLGVTRAGIVSARTLASKRRYAILAAAVIAAVLPGDMITMLLEMLPLYLLFEVSILIATAFERRDARRAARAAPTAPATVVTPTGPAAAAAANTEQTANPTVQQIIDHVDERLSD